MKRFLTCLLTLTLVFAMLPATAFAGFNYENSADGKWVFEADYNANTCTVKGITSQYIKASGGNIVFPKTINNLNVTEIDTNWKTPYSDQTKVVSVTIPSGVTSIGNSAFKHMTALKKVIFDDPSKITKMGTGVFTECHALEAFTMPPNIKKVPDNMFSFCKALKNVKLAAGTTEIGEYAFNDCTALTKITMPSTVKTIKAQAFKGSGLTSVSIPNGVKLLKIYTFAHCKSLKAVSFPSKLETLDPEVFLDCPALERIDIPASCKTIWGKVFKDCPNLTTAIVRGNATIYNNAFVPSAKLTVYCPSSATKITEFCQKSRIANIVYTPKWNTKKRVSVSKVSLKWKPVKKAVKYKVYKKIGTGSYKLVRTTTGTSYTNTGLKKGKTYKYYVKAVLLDDLNKEITSNASATFTTKK